MTRCSAILVIIIGNVDPSNISVDFQMADNGAEFRLILAPVTGAGFFTNFTFTDTITVIPGLAPNPFPGVYQIVGVKDQSDFSLATNSSGLLDVVNSPGPTYDFTAANDAGSPVFIAQTTTITTTSTLTGVGCGEDANPGMSSFELGYIQANTAVPEPAPFCLIGFSLIALGPASNTRHVNRPFGEFHDCWPMEAELCRFSLGSFWGLIAGMIGSKIVNKRGDGLVLDVVLGIVGAIAGGWLFNMFGASGVTGLNLYSLVVAVVGAIAVLVVYHAIRRATQLVAD